jgi:hypothetical protein
MAGSPEAIDGVGSEERCIICTKTHRDMYRLNDQPTFTVEYLLY